MAVTALNTIKNWFRTGLIPTQQQFWDTWDSFRHKSEKIPVAEVTGIDDLLLSKLETATFESHLTDPDAHPELVKIARIIPYGELLVFKTNPEGDPKIKEPGDYCIGFVEDTIVNGNWTGEDDQLKSSYE